MEGAIRAYFTERGQPLNQESIVAIPLEGEGKVNDRVERFVLFSSLSSVWGVCTHRFGTTC
jgi:hypothetical protein